MISLRVLVPITVSLILVGCQEDEMLLEENQKLKTELTELETELQNKKAELEKMSSNLDDYAETNRKLEQELVEVDNQQENIPLFDVFNEKLFVASDTLSHENLTIAKVKELLGEPNEYDEKPAAHGSGKDITLTYDEATFHFRGENEQAGIRALVIKESFLTTSEGITIGSTQEKVRSTYGEYIYEEYSHDEYDNVISIGGKTGMAFRIIDDHVSEIFIWFSYE
ncbi:hypothetical protein HNQ94_000943 [Salirhabdus euzebyi]|uniref:Uncharacterized protein n=1 Tax=Salirhabdus euzebyi TaxID=394506 RepID=A0A841Q342_9BACI|nr:hypothetical protein [Salirhabdus euzebyi]MBB6452498.1 hypothetical protein [Salirhabdus euzebyi]